MLIAAAHDIRLKAKSIWLKSDAQVLEFLEQSKSKRASVLARKIQQRRLHKPLFRASFHADDESAASRALWEETDGAYWRFLTPQKRAHLIERIEELIANEKFGGDLEKAKGSVAISCPNRKMSLKAFDMQVLRGPRERIMRLQESVHRPTQKEIESIIETHENLWKLEVFVDPEVVNVNEPEPFAKQLAAALQNEFGIANEVPLFRNASPHSIDSLLNEGQVCSVISQLGIPVEQLTVGDFRTLTTSAHDDPSKFAEYAERHLKRKGYVRSKHVRTHRERLRRQSK
jgi:hypothetical protein